MKRDADGWKQNRSLRRLDLLPLVHPLRLYLDAGMGLPEALRRLTTRIPSSLQPFVQALAKKRLVGKVSPMPSNHGKVHCLRKLRLCLLPVKWLEVCQKSLSGLKFTFRQRPDRESI